MYSEPKVVFQARRTKAQHFAVNTLPNPASQLEQTVASPRVSHMVAAYAGAPSPHTHRRSIKNKLHASTHSRYVHEVEFIITRTVWEVRGNTSSTSRAILRPLHRSPHSLKRIISPRSPRDLLHKSSFPTLGLSDGMWRLHISSITEPQSDWPQSKLVSVALGQPF